MSQRSEPLLTYGSGLPTRASFAQTRRPPSQGLNWRRAGMHRIHAERGFPVGTRGRIPREIGPRDHCHPLGHSRQRESTSSTRPDPCVGAEVTSSGRQLGIGKARSPERSRFAFQDSDRKIGSMDRVCHTAQRDSGDHSLECGSAFKTIDPARNPANDRSHTNCAATVST